MSDLDDGGTVLTRPIDATRRPAVWLTSLALWCLAGCGGAPADRSFPTPAELAKITRQAPPALPERPPAPRLESWALKGPFPDATDAPPPVDMIGAALLIAEADAARPTAAMTCVARALARFKAHHEGQVPDALKAFIGARCGASASGVQMQWIAGEVRADEQPAAVLARWGDGPGEMVDAVRGALGPRGVYGGGFALHEGRAVWMVVGRDAGQALDGFTGLPDAHGKVTLRGPRSDRYASLSALVTRGRFQFAACEPAPAPAGQYGFDCPVDRADETAVIEVVGVPRGAVLGDRFVSVTAWPSGAPVDVWRAPTGVQAASASGAEGVPAALIEQVNALRAESELPPVVLDAAQSSELAALAPHYWSARWRGDRALADRVALGVLAGWKVEADVRQGHFAAASTDDRADLSALIRDMLSSPYQRRMLFDAHVRRLAVGAMLVGPGRLLALIGGYTIADDAVDPEAAVARVHERFGQLRAAKQQAPLERWAPIEREMGPLREAVRQGKTTPEQALNRALQAASRASRRPVTGYLMWVSDLDDVELPPPLAEGPSRSVAIVVERAKAPGHPWTQSVVLVIWARPTVADAAAAHGPGFAAR